MADGDVDFAAMGLPASFGKVTQSKANQELTARMAKTRREEVQEDEPPRKIKQGPVAGPSRPPQQEDAEEDEDDQDQPAAGPPPPQADAAEDDDVDSDEDLDPIPPEELDPFPVSHEIEMKDHNKVISALAVDATGARVISGSYDYDVKLWDFGGMTASFKPFRSFEPVGNYPIHDVAWSNSGDQFLVASGTWTPKLYDRDGQAVGEFNKGDMYIRDLKNTSGHVAELSALAWHPKDSNLFLTASADSTIRIWEATNRVKSKSVIVIKSKERGGKTKVTAAAYSPDGKMIGAACLDGSIHLWPTSSNFARPSHSVEKAHEKGTVTSSIAFSQDGKTVITRGGDNTVKVWDVKSFRKPIAQRSDLPSIHEQSNAVFSPDEQYVVTGTSGPSPEQLEEGSREMGKLIIMKKSDLSTVRELKISSASVVKIIWHSRINQIIFGSSDGTIRVLYAPHLSIRGATLALAKAPARRRDPGEIPPDDLTPAIITPHALPMFRDETHGTGRIGKRKRERDRQDPVKTLKPAPPILGPGRGGRVGASATQHVVQGLIRENIREQDPREALLKYADADSKYTAAWSDTQPKAILASTTEEADKEAEEQLRKKAKR